VQCHESSAKDLLRAGEHIESALDSSSTTFALPAADSSPARSCAGPASVIVCRGAAAASGASSIEDSATVMKRGRKRRPELVAVIPAIATTSPVAQQLP
jgi:hypothetical protein